MLPPLGGRTTGLPPPLTGPLSLFGAVFPVVLIAKSLLTLPPEVEASRSKAEFSGKRTVTPPPEVLRVTSSENGEENFAEMEPPEVEPSSLPVTFSTSMPPPLVWIRTGPLNFLMAMEPPEVVPWSDPAPPDTSIAPPLVPNFASPARSFRAMRPPEVLSWTLNRGGTVMVYLPSVRCRPCEDSWTLLLARDWMVMVLPSCENVTGRWRR